MRRATYRQAAFAGNARKHFAMRNLAGEIAGPYKDGIQGWISHGTYHAKVTAALQLKAGAHGFLDRLPEISRRP